MISVLIVSSVLLTVWDKPTGIDATVIYCKYVEQKKYENMYSVHTKIYQNWSSTSSKFVVYQLDKVEETRYVK